MEWTGIAEGDVRGARNGVCWWHANAGVKRCGPSEGQGNDEGDRIMSKLVYVS